MVKMGDLERPFSISLIGRDRDASGEIVKRRGVHLVRIPEGGLNGCSAPKV